MMDLVLTSNNFEKRNRELEFAAACSSTPCFLNPLLLLFKALLHGQKDGVFSARI